MLYMFDQFDPRPLFATETQLKEAKVLVEGYQSRKSDPSPQKLEKAQKLVECCLHPDTKEPIFVPFRVSAFHMTHDHLTIRSGFSPAPKPGRSSF
eukprot:jgi/Bigna1/133132/aug1.20_g7840